PAFESRWPPCRTRCGAESPRGLRQGGRRRSHWTTQWFVRHSHVYAPAGRRDRRADRSTLGGLPRARENLRTARLLVDTDSLIAGRGARLLRNVSSGITRPTPRRAATH